MYIYWNLDLEDKVHSISWDLWTSNLQECKGNMLFLKSSGTWNNFRSGSNNLEKFLEGCPNPLSTSPYKLVGGGYTVHNIIQPVGVRSQPWNMSIIFHGPLKQGTNIRLLFIHSSWIWKFVQSCTPSTVRKKHCSSQYYFHGIFFIPVWSP